MHYYIIRRLFQSIPILFAVLTLVFIIVRILPGDPAVAALGENASREAVNALREKMGLNEPLWIQYFQFLAAICRGNLGVSMITGYPVATQVLNALPYSLELTFSAVLFGYIFGIPIGIAAAVKRNTFIDYFSRVFSLTGLSFPGFFLGILLMLFFSIKLKLFPVVGGGDLSSLSSTLKYLFLPSLTLGLIMTAYVTRMTRSSVLNVLREDYVRTARSKGLSRGVILFKHALRNALISVVALGGVYAISLIGTSVMTEIVFSRPGLGTLMVGAIQQRDYTAVQSVMICYSLIVIVLNLATDLIYALIDPRIHYR